MKTISVARRSFIVLIAAGLMSVSSFAGTLKDSLDVQINRRLDEIYTDLYFTDYVKSAEALDQQVQIASQAGRWHMVVSALTLKAKCAYNHYLGDKTYSILLEAEALAEQYKTALDSLDPVREYRSEINYVRGMHFHEVGDFSRSISSFEVIIDNHRKYKGIDPFYLYYVYSFIGHASLQLMLFDKAYLNYEEALAMLALSQGDKNSYQYAMANLYKGQCKEYKARSIPEPKLARDAIVHYKQALSILLRQKDKLAYRGALTSAYTRLAAANSFLEQYDSALLYLGKSLRFQQSGEPTLSLIYADFGDIYIKTHQYLRALEFYDKSIAVTNASYKGNHFQKSIPMLKKSELQLLTGKLTEALMTCQEALTQMTGDSSMLSDIKSLPGKAGDMNTSLLLDGLMLHGRIHATLYKSSGDTTALQKALDTYRAAIEVIQRSHLKFPDGEYKQTLASKVQPLYEYALDAAFMAHEKNPNDADMTEMIFSLMESNKNTMLRDATNNTLALEYQGVPSSTLEMESFLKGSIASMRAKLFQNPADSAIAEWKRELLSLTRKYDSLVNKISKDHPKYFELKYGVQLITMKEAKRALPAHTLMVEYFWGERAVFILSLSNSGCVVKKVLLDDDLKETVSGLLTALQNGKSSSDNTTVAFARLARHTYTRLLGPVMQARADQTNMLVVIPDGLLAYVPFDILLYNDATPNDSFKALPYLVRYYDIRSIFSAAQLQVPQYQKSFSYNYVGFAPEYQDTQLTSDGVRGSTLSHNIDEVTEAAHLFGGRSFVGHLATEEKFRAESSQGKLLHLSMHGVVNEDEPSFSALLFTPGDTIADNAERDGLVYLHDLYSLPVNAEMAILSACETGRGRYQRGEGMMSLGRAFRYAGCENIVMSLWKANDNTTARLMKKLFVNLKSGMQKGEALRQAKLAFIDAPENKYFTHPYYWSGFVLVGDSTPVSNAPINWHPVWIAIALITLVFATFYIKRK